MQAQYILLYNWMFLDVVILQEEFTAGSTENRSKWCVENVYLTVTRSPCLTLSADSDDFVWLCSFISYVMRIHNISRPPTHTHKHTHENAPWPSGVSDACGEHSRDRRCVWEGYQHGLLQRGGKAIRQTKVNKRISSWGCWNPRLGYMSETLLTLYYLYTYLFIFIGLLPSADNVHGLGGYFCRRPAV